MLFLQSRMTNEDMKFTKRKVFTYFYVLIGLGFLFGSCSKTESYSELLREEEKAVNVYLATQRVENSIPSDSVSFEIGKNAPFYRLDEDGYVYMQIVSKGDIEDKIEEGDRVYFRFMRQNLKYYAEGTDTDNIGNSDYLAYGSTSFIYGNTYLTSSLQWGTGIQMPLKFVGYNSEVNLVLKSYYGFTDDQTYCIPYLVNVRYFRPEY